MNLFCGAVILGSLVLVALGGCSDAARDASSNAAPVAKEVSLSATNSPAYINTTLKGSYRYADDGDIESGTLKVWLRDGQPIEDADQDTYTATAQDLDKTLQFRVTPAAATGKSPGAAVLSSGIKIENSPPSIADLTILSSDPNNEVYLGVQLSASYSFQDIEGNGEGATAYQWQRNGVPIGGAKEQIYIVTDADVGKALTIQITPKDNFVSVQSGTPVMSTSVTVALASSANVILTVSPGLKQLHFSWAPLLGASTYSVLYNPDGVSGFVPLSATSVNLIATTYAWDIAVHRINWPKAQFMVEACKNINACVRSASVSALNVMLGAIGYVKASNTGGGDGFGSSVALSTDGNTLAVGAYGEASNSTGIGNEAAPYAGAVYVYTRANGAWSLQPAYVKASNSGAEDYFGYSVALSADGNTLAVGAHGEDSSSTGINSTPDESASNAGAVYVYTRSGNIWTQQAYVKASNTGADDSFGRSVALSADGHTLAVGADTEASSSTGIDSTPNELAPRAGAVYVYTRNRSSGLWFQQAYVKASNTGAGDIFGTSIALSADGNTLAVGADAEASKSTGIDSTPNELALSAGAVYVYTRSGVTWTPQAYVKASNTGASDTFGRSIALSADGNTLAVGAPFEDSAKTGVIPGAPVETATPNEALGTDFGAVYVYVRSGATWAQQAYVKASNTGAGDYFGWSVALSADGSTLAVGAQGEDSSSTGIDTTPNESAQGAGAVYVYIRSAAGMWSQQTYLKASNPGADDRFGRPVALSADGNTLAVGAFGEDSAATGVNNTTPGQSDNTASFAGAVYLY